MMNSLRILSMGIITALLLTMSARAAQIYAVETTSFMQQPCSEEDTSQLTQAIAAIEYESESLSDKSIGLISLGQTAQLLSMPGARADMMATLKALPAGSDTQINIASGLLLARELLSNQPAGNHRISLFISPAGLAASEDFDKQALALMGQGIDIDVVLTCPSEQTSNINPTYTWLRLRILDSTPAPAETTMLSELQKLLAPLFGLEAQALGVDTDFIRDLQSDAYTAIEALQVACDHFNVIAPQRDDLTTLRQLAEYIRTAEQEGLTVRAMGPRERPQIPEPVYLQTVYYGTNRQRAETLDEPPFYNGLRATKGRLSYGYCEVSIPVNVHEKGRIETPFLSLNFFVNPAKHIYLKEVAELSREVFFAKLNEGLASNQTGEAWGQDIVVFIHGFNVSFENAAKRTAQLAYDFNFKGSPIMFTWPSDSALLSYVSDREDIEWSVPHIESFLEDIIAQAKANRVHIVAHSMGNEGLLRALRGMALKHGFNQPPLFDNVLLAAPDVDAEIFADQLAPLLVPLARRWTLYASDNDSALNLSSTLRSAPRLGLPLTLVEGVDTVDATGVEVTPWSVPEFHSYYATKLRVIQDFVAVLRGKAPTERRLVAARKNAMPYWVLEDADAN